MIDHKHKFIFIHIPKTGGTSIEKLFIPTADIQNVNLKHDTLRTILGTRPKIKNYFKFTVVRNPWDLTASLYYYMWKSQYEWPQRWRKMISAQIPGVLDMSLNDWVNHESFAYSGPRSRSLFNKNPTERLQLDWISNNTGSPEMDYIIKFENLQNDFDNVCNKLGLPFQNLPHINKTDREPYGELYTTETREIVARKFKKDIDFFQYEFGE
tara:strand:+ start:2326 stop:2958 length:633 start_codon:yes stop_codon:yes gene_type:complete